MPVSAGRRGVVEDELGQLDQKLWGPSALDKPRLLFNDIHCLSLLQLLSNVIQPHLHHSLPVQNPQDLENWIQELIV